MSKTGKSEENPEGRFMCLMRHAARNHRQRLSFATVLGSLVAMILLSAQVVAQPVDDSGRAIEQTISQQLDAFSSDDAQRAFSFASPAIKRGFASAEAFMAMVHQRYPAVYEASTVRFRERVPHSGFKIQRVQFIGPQGRYWDAFYRMEQLSDGQWCIGGVVLKPITGGI